MFNRIHGVCRLLLGSALVLTLLAAVGCTGGGGDPTNAILGTVANAARQNTLLIRVVNATTSTVETTIRVDGQIKLLPACSPTQRVCDFFLTKCPSMVELIEETRRDPVTEAFMGGRNFESNPDFIFTDDEFDCSATLIFQFSESQASAQAM